MLDWPAGRLTKHAHCPQAQHGTKQVSLQGWVGMSLHAALLTPLEAPKTGLGHTELQDPAKPQLGSLLPQAAGYRAQRQGQYLSAVEVQAQQLAGRVPLAGHQAGLHMHPRHHLVAVAHAQQPAPHCAFALVLGWRRHAAAKDTG